MKTEEIDGGTRLYAIIGDPISSVRSPAVYNALFARRGINAVFVPLHVAAGDLAAAWAGLKATRNFDGLVVTMPHKNAMCELVDELLPDARLVGAVNTVRRRSDGRWEGDMFDGIGCVDGLRRQGHEVAGRSVFLAGVGGAGAAIAMALVQAGVARLVIADLDAARRDGVIARIRAALPQAAVEVGSADSAPYDIAINATPLGMRAGDPLPFDPAKLPPTTLIVDVINKPEITALLALAQKTGHPIHPGRHLHHGQAIAAAKFFGFDLLA